MEPKYKKILLKLSGEALAGEKGTGIDFNIVNAMCKPIKKCHEMGIQIGLVIGGGNFWRGRSSGSMNRTRADSIGMIATLMNAIGFCDALEQNGVPAVVQTAVPMPKMAEYFTREKAEEHFKEGKVVLFACGTGNPFFSTDSAAALRAAEIEADVVLKATKVDGVYDSDPEKNPNAIKYDNLTFQDVLNKNLGVIDSTAASLCKDNNIPLLVFNMADPNNIIEAVMGKNIGTIVK